MILLRADGLKKSFGTNVLFEGVGLAIDEKERVGLVGVNGGGKTTLMRILCGLDSADQGQVWTHRALRVGYLAQFADYAPQRCVYDETLGVFEPLMEAERALEALRHDIDARRGDLDALILRQAALHDEYLDGGGMTFRTRTRAALLGMGFSAQDLALPMSALSGGQRSKVQMAKLLLSRADMLMLDEPTNHLDIQSVEWLEGYLREYPGSMIIISHDRYFLDRVSTATLEMEHGKLTRYDGGYSKYLEEKARLRVIEEKHFHNAQKEIARMEAMITRFRRWNRERSIRTAEHKERQLDKLKATTKRPERAPLGIRFNLNAQDAGGQDVIIAQNLSMAFDAPLFSNVSLHLRRGERVFILGPNGCGKTTLMRILMGANTPTGGTVRLGAHIAIGYYDQHQHSLDEQGTPLSELQRAYPGMDTAQARAALAAFLFRGDDVYKPVAALSGGERARIELLKLMLGRANLLMLDEPTNHLDAASREALEAALMDYEGTILAITHDRYLVNRLATRVVALGKEGLTESAGGYDAYLELAAAQRQAAAPPAPEDEKPAPSAQRRDNAAQIRRLRAQLRAAEDEVERLEIDIAAQQALLADPEVACDYERAMAESERLDEFRAALAAAMARWEALCHRLGDDA